MKVQVFSSSLVTAENKSGSGEIDLDTPEGISIFGGKDAAEKYLADRLIGEKMQSMLRSMAIAELIKEGKLPEDYKEN